MLKNSSLTDRTDISDFIIHFTRDSTENFALDNLISILNDMKINANEHHCLFNNPLKEQSQEIRENFNVACFTETPLHKLKNIFNIQNKQKHFKPYGVIFFKDLLNEYWVHENEKLGNHPNPVFYVSGDNKTLVKYFFEQYEQWLEDLKNNKANNFHLFGSLINLVNEKHNFIWEREWRTVGDYKFITPDVVAVIAPENEHNLIREKVYSFSNSMTIIDIEWSFETLLSKISSFAWNNQYKYEQVSKELEKLKCQIFKSEIHEEKF